MARLFNAAMETVQPKVSSSSILRWRTGSELTAKRPTSLMVHVEGHGPRRVYRSDHTGRYYIFMKKRRVQVDPIDVARVRQNQEQLA